MKAFILGCLLACTAGLARSQFHQLGPKLAGMDAVGAATQGFSVALSSDGNTAIVGGTSDNGAIGAAWVYTRTAGAWSQQGPKLVGSGAVGLANQGWSVSLSADGNTALFGGLSDSGSSGAAWVFTRTEGVWNQQGSKLVGTGAVGSAQQGYSVALSADGNTAIVGGLSDNGGSGAAWVFTRSGGVWSQQGSKLIGTGAVGSAQQGYSVALSADGNTAIVGGRSDNSSTGAAWVFTRSGSVWSQQGSKLVGTGAVGNANQGTSVSLSSNGNTSIVGGYADNISTGAAWVFTRTGGVWSQQGSKLVGAGAVGAAQQGFSVSLSGDGNLAIVGGWVDNNDTGAMWVFTRTGGVWSQQGSKLVGAGAAGAALQGTSVSLSSDGSTAIAGGYTDSGGIGAAWVYVSAPPKIASVSDLPFDQGGVVVIDWNGSFLDEPGSTIISSYWVWRGIRSASASPGSVRFSREEYISKLVKHQLTDQMIWTAAKASSATGDIYWQYITSLPAHGLAHYSYACPTLADSTAEGIPWRYSFITAVTRDPGVYWDSPVDSGYSVDNLAPMTPGGGAIHFLPNSFIALSWNPDLIDPDLSHYDVYRSQTNGFAISDSTRIRVTADTAVVDSATVPGHTYYYRITAVDIHGNQSLPSAQLGGTALSVSQNSEAPTEFALEQNYPNPFNPSTAIRYALPERSHVSLTVFNVLGERVIELVNGDKEAGYHDANFDGSGLASGVYFYRLEAHPFEMGATRMFTSSRKMLFLK